MSSNPGPRHISTLITESRSSLVRYLKKHHIHVYNGLPTQFLPLLLHCASRDDDFGTRQLSSGQNFSWNFKSNAFETTLYFCRFSCGPKTASFVVFNAGWADTYKTYNYVVRDDGFYVNYGLDNNYHKLDYSWQ